MAIITLRAATREDCWDIFSWRNDPTTIAFSPSGKVKKENHLRWFEEKIISATSSLYIVMNETGDKVGIIRFDRQMEDAEISINMNPLFRGKGYGTEALKKAIAQYFSESLVQRLIAKVVPENSISKHLFQKNGFKEGGRERAFVILMLGRENHS